MPVLSFQIVPHLAALGAAYALALPIAWDREKRDRSAGLRTFPLVAIAACGFIQAAESLLVNSPEGIARIVEGVITGIGFIGGGAILKTGASSSWHGDSREPLGNRRSRRGRRARELRCCCRYRRDDLRDLKFVTPFKVEDAKENPRVKQEGDV